MSNEVVVEKKRTYRITPRTVYEISWTDNYSMTGGVSGFALGGGGGGFGNPIITCSTLEVAEDMMDLLAKKHI